MSAFWNFFLRRPAVRYWKSLRKPGVREMSGGIGIERTYQLYRDYIDNFVIGSRRNKI
jgi:adenine-specific DNA-methyltransferase